MGERTVPFETFFGSRAERGMQQWRTMAVGRMDEYFDTYPDPATRLAETEKGLQTLAEYDVSKEIVGRLRTDLAAAFSITDREAYSKAIVSALQPLFEWQAEHPDVTQRMMRDGFFKSTDTIPLSDVLSYNRGNDGEVHIHIAPSEDIPNLLSEVDAGLRALCEEFAQDRSLQTVKATSWIVAEHPKVLERFGFTVYGLVSEEVRKKYFEHESRPVAWATMSREVLEKRYKLKENV